MAEIDDAELTALRAEANRAGQVDTELASLRQSAAAELRAAVLVAHPELPEQLVVGSTAAELAASVAGATAVVESIRERTLNELRGLTPARAPMGFRPPSPGGERPVRDLSGMTAAEKIRAGLDARNKGG